ncbi:NADH-quinone oxidoreductase subunit K [Myxococcaceae bacterium]|jgi:multicomponent Na+:H+ antiporter subunit C|nr:NADH-quinone oxidoreductase subunit K [Myxococcaceae bacterium]
MAPILAIAIGALFGTGLYLMLRRSLVKLVLGLSFLAHGANLLIFGVGGLVEGHPPIVAEGETVLVPPYADPLPQALILTAIVISFAVTAFALVLVYRARESLGSDDLDDLGGTRT